MFDALNFSNWNFKKRYVLHIQLLEAESQIVMTLNIHYCLLLLCLIILGKVKRKKIKYNKLNQPTNTHLKNVRITPMLQIQSFAHCQLNAFTLKLGIPTKEPAAYNRFKTLLGCSQPELKWLNNTDYLNVSNT